jgi:flagellar basal body P-ring formation protein FlgA
MIRALALALLLLTPAPALATALLAPSEPLTAALIEALVAERLSDERGSARLEIVIDEPRLPLGNPVAATTLITLEGFFRDTRGRFAGTLVGHIGEELRFRLTTRGRIRELARLPVLARPLAAGERVAAGDLASITLAAGRVPPTALTDAGQMIGAEARRHLTPGRILHARDLAPARLVRRGRPVQLVYSRPGLHLSLQALAQEDGAAGDVVRVLNPASGHEVQGLVTGPDEVTIAALGD